MRSAFFSILALSAACASAPTVGRAPLVPPLAASAPVADLEPKLLADADRSAPVGESVRVGFVEAPPMHGTIVEYVDEPNSGNGPASLPVQYVDGGEWRYYEREARRHREPFFPINTAVGVGVGAVIGNQSRHRGRGALIGGSLGLMLDLARWLR